MSRTLKRPMFRRGGTVNNGIMTGLTDRKQYANGKTLQEYMKEAEAVLPKQEATRFPIGQLGLNLASGQFAGDGFLQNLVGSLQNPYSQYIKADDARKARDYQRKLALAQFGLERKAKAEDLDKTIQARKDIAKMTLEGKENKDLTVFKKIYQGSETQAKNRLAYENSGLEAVARKIFGDNYAEFIGGNVHGKLEDFEKKQNIGKVFFDVTDGKFKRLRLTSDNDFKFEIIDLATFDAEADKAKIVPKETFPGEKSENPSYRRPPKDFTIPEVDPFDPFSS
tara:strand:- start:1967 stop:2809 length:843 start_codon:yes stop_codon:yes gene_type:complete